MSKVLVFKDGHSVEFTDNSTITNLTTVVNSYTAIDTIASYFTEANLVGATFDGESLLDVIPVSMEATSDYDSVNVTVTFFNRYKTDSEIFMELITEIQEALAELAGA